MADRTCPTSEQRPLIRRRQLRNTTLVRVCVELFERLFHGSLHLFGPFVVGKLFLDVDHRLDVLEPVLVLLVLLLDTLALLQPGDQIERLDTARFVL